MQSDIIKKVQKALGVTTSGVMDNATRLSIINFQMDKNMIADGILDSKVINALGISDTDLSGNFVKFGDVVFEKYHMNPDSYFEMKNGRMCEYIILHHTRGLCNPYHTIDTWDRNKNAKIGTEFVIGGINAKTSDSTYDGKILQAIPSGCYAQHVGKVGNENINLLSVGIEMCNMGFVDQLRGIDGQLVDEKYIVELQEPYRGKSFWHKYTDAQLYSLKKLILAISKRDNIDPTSGVVSVLNRKGKQDAFDFQEEAYKGTTKGMWFHCNLRKDKYDLFPQDELCDMLKTL